MVGIAAGVQDLHADLAAFGVHGVGHETMARHLARIDSLPAKGLAQPARFGAMPPLTSRPGAAARARGEIGRELREIARAIFEPGMHRTHDDAVRQAREAQIERGKQAPVFHGRR